jgi:hypothetical protein
MYPVQPTEVEIPVQELGNIVIGEGYIVLTAGDGGKRFERRERNVCV